MENGQSEVELDGVPESEARAELERLLADPRFKMAERNRNFLRYITDARYKHGSAGVKSYIIAIDVFGRPDSFDGQNDPIVRIEANRLRTGLDQYYQAHGEPGRLRIDLPKGRYIPRFNRIDGGGDDLVPNADEAATVGSPVGDDVPKVSGRVRRQGWLVAVAVAATAAFFTLMFPPTSSVPVAPMTEKPGVALAMTTGEEALKSEAERTFDDLMAALSQFQTLRIIDGRGRPDAATATYRVDLKYRNDDEGPSIWWQVSDGRNGEILKAGIERVPAKASDGRAVRDRLVADLASDIASTRGVINRLEAGLAAQGALGNACVLRAENIMDEGMFDDLPGLETCLRASVARDPTDADAKATLARFLVVSRPNGSDHKAVDEALGLASTGVLIAPGSERAETALMFAQFAAGQTDVALETGRRAMVLNPDSIELTAKVGLFFAYAGRWSDATALAMNASASENPPRAAVLTLSLEAYRRGDFAASARYAAQVNCGDILVRAIRIAATAHIDAEEARVRYANLKAQEPGFDKALAGSLSARRLTPDLVKALTAGLQAAGVQITGDVIAAM
ncbi:tetratricopeptide repeat protein [Rhizobium sp. A37_96]